MRSVYGLYLETVAGEEGDFSLFFPPGTFDFQFFAPDPTGDRPTEVREQLIEEDAKVTVNAPSF